MLINATPKSWIRNNGIAYCLGAVMVIFGALLIGVFIDEKWNITYIIVCCCVGLPTIIIGLNIMRISMSSENEYANLKPPKTKSI